MYKIVVVLIICCILQSCKEEKEIPNQIYSAINNIKNEYAPDKRTRIFDITPKWHDRRLVLKGELTDKILKEKLLNTLADIEFVDSIDLLPAKNLGGHIYGIVTIPVANMRSAGKHSAELANQLLCGTVARLYKKIDGWYFCQTPDDYLGWLDEDALFVTDSTGLQNWYDRPKTIITQDQTYLYTAPTTVASIMSPLNAGAVVATGYDTKAFDQVSLPDGRSGFLPASHGTDFSKWKIIQAQSRNVESILKMAYSLTGRPYLWGGTSVNGMDCSGFTKTVFFNHGLLLPRDASQQVFVGKPIVTDTTLKNLEAGDLLFFGRHASGDKPEKITHVAIYAGQGKIIHASGYIKQESLTRGDSTFNEYRLKSFIRATRPLAAPSENGIPDLKDLKYYN